MAKHIIIGFTGQEASAKSFPVYVGESGVEAAEAMKASNAVRFEVYTGVRGVRKHNPRHDASKPADFVANVLVKAPVDGVDQVDRVDELLTTIQTLKAEKEKDAASLAEMIAAHDAQGHSLKHAEARIALLEKELSSARAETRNSSTNTTVDESAPGLAAGAAGPGAINSSAGQEAQTPPPGSQGDGDGSPDSVSSAAPTTTPQVPAAAPKGMQQQAKGRR
jgi:hypothetical protein